MDKTLCHTIGHSVHPIDQFIALLKQHNINCIVDVRSSPYSKFASQYNREALNAELKKSGIAYLYMGDSLGARYEEKTLLFADGKVDFDKVRETEDFQKGIERVIDGINKGFTISLMCSEKDPFDCHRFVLVSKSLQDASMQIKHIMPDGVIDNTELEEKMFKKYKLSRHDLFSSEKENIDNVYRKRNIDIAYNAFTKEGDDE
ncbi:DUF488 family protein [Campylobacterota bacterium]